MKKLLQEFDNAIKDYTDAALLHGGAIRGTKAFDISERIYEKAKEDYVKAARSLQESIMQNVKLGYGGNV